MKIKLNEPNKAEWRFIGCDEVNLYEGKLITYRESKKYGYRFNIIMLNDNFYITQALYTAHDDKQYVSVHKAKSVNDAKAVLEVMIQFIKGMRQPVHETDA